MSTNNRNNNRNTRQIVETPNAADVATVEQTPTTEPATEQTPTPTVSTDDWPSWYRTGEHDALPAGSRVFGKINALLPVQDRAPFTDKKTGKSSLLIAAGEVELVGSSAVLPFNVSLRWDKPEEGAKPRPTAHVSMGVINKFQPAITFRNPLDVAAVEAWKVEIGNMCGRRRIAMVKAERERLAAIEAERKANGGNITTTTATTTRESFAAEDMGI